MREGRPSSSTSNPSPSPSPSPNPNPNPSPNPTPNPTPNTNPDPDPNPNPNQAKVRAAATESDPLYLDGGEIEIRWPNSFEGTARLRQGKVHYRPAQARRKARNVYLIQFERRRGGPVRERETYPPPSP